MGTEVDARRLLCCLADVPVCCSSKFNLAPIDIDSYRAWLASRLSTTSTASSSDTAQTTYINGDNTPAIPTSAHYERQRRLSTTNPAQVTSSSSSTPLNPSVASTTLPAPISDLDHPTRHPTQPTTAQLSPSPTPSYPPNFASLIDLIISNQPIPDIQTYSDDLNPLSTAALHAKTPVPIRRKPWELVNDDSVTSVQDVGVRTGIATDGIKASVSAVPVAGATADEGGQQQPSDATNIIKTPTTLEEKADTQMSEEEQQGQKSEGSRRLDQSTFRSDGRPTWYDDIGVPLFNDDHNRTDSTSPEIEGDVPQAREDQSLDEAPRSILAAGL